MQDGSYRLTWPRCNVAPETAVQWKLAPNTTRGIHYTRGVTRNRRNTRLRDLFRGGFDYPCTPVGHLRRAARTFQFNVTLNNRSGRFTCTDRGR